MILASFFIGIQLAGSVIDRAGPRSDARFKQHLIRQRRFSHGAVADKNNVADLFRLELGHVNPPSSIDGHRCRTRERTWPLFWPCAAENSSFHRKLSKVDAGKDFAA